jgi:hypothetical protein
MTLTIIARRTGQPVLCLSGHPYFVLKAIIAFNTLGCDIYSWRVNPAAMEYSN